VVYIQRIIDEASDELRTCSAETD